MIDSSPGEAMGVGGGGAVTGAGAHFFFRRAGRSFAAPLGREGVSVTALPLLVRRPEDVWLRVL